MKLFSSRKNQPMEPSFTQLQNIFEQNDSETIISKQEEILSIIDIDTLLQISLNVNRNYDGPRQLNRQQIAKLYQVFQPNVYPNLKLDQMRANSDNKQQEEEQPPVLERQITANIVSQEDEFVIYLDLNNDVWHRYLKPEYAERMRNFVDSKWMLIAVIPILILSFLCRFPPLFVSVLWNYQFIPAFLGSIWVFMHLLCFNLSMMKRMLRCFAFWFKIWNWFIAITSYMVLTEAPFKREGGNVIVGTLIIFCAAGHDAWRMNRGKGMALGCAIIALCIVFGGYIYFDGRNVLGKGWLYSDPPFKDKTIVIFGELISWKSLCLGGIFNLFIFFAKQLLVMIKFKGKASVLSSRAKIKWVDDWDQHRSQHIYYGYHGNINKNVAGNIVYNENNTSINKDRTNNLTIEQEMANLTVNQRHEANVENDAVSYQV